MFNRQTPRQTLLRMTASLGLLVALAACARSNVTRGTANAPQAADPYQKALQMALIRQHFGQAQQAGEGYRLGILDVVEIHVFEYEKMNTVTRIGENGCLSLPPVGEVQVVGLTERQLEALLQERLRGRFLQDPHVTVLVKEPHALDVAVVGEVTKPGRYSLLGQKNLLEVIAEAGGMTEKAGRVAYLIRVEKGTTGSPAAALTSATLQRASLGLVPEANSLRIDLDGLLIRGEEQWNVPLKSGDLVNIPEAGWVHVTGRGVAKPGTYPLTRTAKSLCQVLDEAGGLKWEAAHQLHIVRKEDSGRERILPADYRKIQKDSRNDVAMQAGDTVITDRTLVKGTLAALGAGIVRLVHVGIYGSVPLFGTP